MVIKHKEEILIDESYLQSLLEEINQAKSCIDIEVYIFDDDHVGRIVTDALCDAAKRGVQIRVMVDGIGSIHWGGKMAQQMVLNGIKIKVYHPLPWRISHWSSSTSASKFIFSRIIFLLSKINNRDHRKVCIIDQHIVFVGSANISAHLLGDQTHKGWRETTVKLVDINTDEIQYAFDKAWGKVSLKRRLYKIFKRKKTDSIFLLNYSWRLRRQYYKELLHRISQCKKQIWITNAYFVPDSFLLKKLIKASGRGIDLKILLPEKSDISLMPIVKSTFYSILLKNKAQIYEYKPTILHAKTLMIDDWYVIGSSNLNYRSFKHDLEVNVSLQTPPAKEVLTQQFLFDLKQSNQLMLDNINNLSLFKKMIVRLILLIRYWI